LKVEAGRETSAANVDLRRALEADLPFIMATERLPGYERVVGRWDEALHRTTMAQSGTAYFIGEVGGEPVGFVMLLDLEEYHGNVLLKRIAMAAPGRGYGRRILRLVMGWVFARPRSHRFWLTVAPHNERARHLYASLGFQEDGVLREAHVNPAGERVSSVLMSILRPEWESSEASRA
jgi:RimJ/RimL family protein N-acetyltransferase